MHKKVCLFIVLAFVVILLSSFNTEAATAVTIALEDGPSFVEEGVTEVNLIVPERPAESLPLNIEDKVFFEVLEPYLKGEGSVTNIYETDDQTLYKAIVIDHISN